MSEARMVIKRSTWQALMLELKVRGRGERESGAFLLGPSGGREITEFVCFDDLDPHSLDTGIVVFDSSGFVPLWQLCSERELKVLADVHTHPKGWTGLSELDIAHPMLHQRGHIGLIVPHFAQRQNATLKGVGVHEYLGNKEWKTWKTKSIILQILPQ